MAHLGRRAASAASTTQSCPCGSGQSYAECCGRFLEDGLAPASAEELMRSRYTAFTREDFAYLRATWHPVTCPRELHAEDPAPHWLGLKILACTAGGPEDDEGAVEFVARYKIAGRAFRLHERSRFVRHAGHWLYRDGIDPATGESISPS